MSKYYLMRAISIVFFFSLVILLSQSLAGDPLDDCQVTGNLKIDGQDAPVGTTMEAFIDGEKVASEKTTVQGKYSLIIHKSNAGIPGYESELDVVVIKVNQKQAEPSFNPHPGPLKINLEVKTSLDVKPTTWGKIKALFK